MFKVERTGYRTSGPGKSFFFLAAGIRSCGQGDQYGGESQRKARIRHHRAARCCHSAGAWKSVAPAPPAARLQYPYRSSLGSHSRNVEILQNASHMVRSKFYKREEGLPLQTALDCIFKSTTQLEIFKSKCKYTATTSVFSREAAFCVQLMLSYAFI